MTREIPRQQWSGVFEDLSRRCHGWLTSIDGGDGQGQPPLPLDSIAMTLDGSDDTVTLTLTQPSVPQGHDQRAVPRPSRIVLTEAPDWTELRIETASSPVRVRLAPAPDVPHAI